MLIAMPFWSFSSFFISLTWWFIHKISLWYIFLPFENVSIQQKKNEGRNFCENSIFAMKNATSCNFERLPMTPRQKWSWNLWVINSRKNIFIVSWTSSKQVDSALLCQNHAKFTKSHVTRLSIVVKDNETCKVLTTIICESHISLDYEVIKKSKFDAQNPRAMRLVDNIQCQSRFDYATQPPTKLKISLSSAHLLLIKQTLGQFTRLHHHLVFHIKNNSKISSSSPCSPSAFPFCSSSALDFTEKNVESMDEEEDKVQNNPQSRNLATFFSAYSNNIFVLWGVFCS